MRLVGLYQCEYSYRELWVLIQRLPQDSWTQTILRDQQLPELINPADEAGPEKFGPWSLHNYQLVALTDAVRRLEVTVARSVGGSDAKYPDPTPCPGRARRARRQSDAAVAYLKKLRGKG